MLRSFAYLMLLALAVNVFGCRPADSASAHKDQEVVDADAHDHAESGEHGGHVLMLGDAHCAELVADHESNAVSLYILEEANHQPVGGDVTDVVISVFVDGEFVEYAFGVGDEPGKFVLESEELCDRLDHAEDVKARIKATIGGEQLQAAYEHESHGEDADHDHEGE